MDNPYMTAAFMQQLQTGFQNAAGNFTRAYEGAADRRQQAYLEGERNRIQMERDAAQREFQKNQAAAAWAEEDRRQKAGWTHEDQVRADTQRFQGAQEAARLQLQDSEFQNRVRQEAEANRRADEAATMARKRWAYETGLYDPGVEATPATPAQPAIPGVAPTYGAWDKLPAWIRGFSQVKPKPAPLPPRAYEDEDIIYDTPLASNRPVDTGIGAGGSDTLFDVAGRALRGAASYGYGGMPQGAPAQRQPAAPPPQVAPPAAKQPLPYLSALWEHAKTMPDLNTPGTPGVAPVPAKPAVEGRAGKPARVVDPALTEQEQLAAGQARQRAYAMQDIGTKAKQAEAEAATQRAAAMTQAAEARIAQAEAAGERGRFKVVTDEVPDATGFSTLKRVRLFDTQTRTFVQLPGEQASAPNRMAELATQFK